MKVKSEDELLKLIELARERGTISFLSDNMEGDRQKLYRVIRGIESMPLFPHEYKFVIRASKQVITIDRKDEATIVLVDRPVISSKTIVEKPKKQRRLPEWIVKHLEEVATVEQLVNQQADQGQWIELKQRIDTRLIAVEHYLELFELKHLKDEPLIELIKTSFSNERFDQLVIKAFDPQHYDEAPEPMTRRQLLAKRMGEIRNSQDPEDVKEFKRLLEDHEQLIKKEDEEWASAKNLLS
jgi:hypothetical protein